MGTDSRDEDLVLRSRIPAAAQGTPLLDYLSRRFPYHDRQRWHQELQSGRVLVAGARATPTQLVRGGEDLAYHKVHREPWVDEHMPVLHRDDAVLVVEKPAHLPMHADGPFVRSTLVHLLRERFGEPGLSLVHRLDRETSGVCVVARQPEARASLHEQFERGAVGKTYLAVVSGLVAADFVVDAPIGHARDSTIALRRATGAAAVAAQPAETRFRVLERGPRASLLQCEPRTGRTHQIRVHLESVGHPILGDKLYGRSDEHYLDFVRAVKRSGDPRLVANGQPGRQLLHADSLSFRDPTTQLPVTHASPMPAEFAAWLRGAPPATQSPGE